MSRLLRALSSGRIDPVYLITGTDDFLRRRAAEAIVAAAIGDEVGGTKAGGLGLAVERLDGAKTPLVGILDAARSLPLFLPVTGRPVRVVWVSGFVLPPAEDVELLKEYLQSPVDSTCLILEIPALDARRAASKLLNRYARRVDCRPPERESDLRRWIDKAAKARGLVIDPEALTYLIEMVGSDLLQLHQELDKVTLLVGERDRIKAGDLEELLGRSREHSVFELTDWLVRGSVDESLAVLNHLLDDGEEPLRLLAMVSWVVRQLITAQDLSAKGCEETDLLKQLGGRWDQRREVVDRARRSSGESLGRMLVACADADIAVKTQRGLAGRGVLETLCRRLCAA